MGREARAAARWGDAAGMVTALLEGDVLIVRGEIRATVARSAIRDVVVEAGELRFLAGDVRVVLTLGTTAANRWANAIATGPPTLEAKLGIDAATIVRVYGAVDDDLWKAALATAAARIENEARAATPPTLVFIRANGARDLETALTAHLASADAALPLWVVYRKGKDVPLNEAAVRAAVRARGLTDTKVAGISATLSALRFSNAEPEPASPPRRATPLVARPPGGRPSRGDVLPVKPSFGKPAPVAKAGAKATPVAKPGAKAAPVAKPGAKAASGTPRATPKAKAATAAPRGTAGPGKPRRKR